MKRSTEILILRFAYVIIILLLAAIAIPSFVKSRNYISQNSCPNNLSAIAQAKEEWVKANGKTNGDAVVVVEVNRYIHGNTLPQCPYGGSYSYNVIGSNPTCTVTSPK